MVSSGAKYIYYFNETGLITGTKWGVHVKASGGTRIHPTINTIASPTSTASEISWSTTLSTTFYYAPEVVTGYSVSPSTTVNTKMTAKGDTVNITYTAQVAGTTYSILSTLAFSQSYKEELNTNVDSIISLLEAYNANTLSNIVSTTLLQESISVYESFTYSTQSALALLESNTYSLNFGITTETLQDSVNLGHINTALSLENNFALLSTMTVQKRAPLNSTYSVFSTLNIISSKNIFYMSMMHSEFEALTSYAILSESDPTNIILPLISTSNVISMFSTTDVNSYLQPDEISPNVTNLVDEVNLTPFEANIPLTESINEGKSYSTTFEISLVESLKTAIKYYTVVSFVANMFNVIGGLRVRHLYDIKNYDLIREGNTAIIWLDNISQDYIGFGNESWGTYSVYTDVYLIGQNTQAQLDTLIKAVHESVANYAAKGDMIENDMVVWFKLSSEENLQSDLRGATKYRFEFEVRVYIIEMGGKYGIEVIQ